MVPNVVYSFLHVVILTIYGFEVKSTNGDTHLGGEDLLPLESTVMVAMVYNI